MALTVADVKAGMRARGYERDTDSEQTAFIETAVNDDILGAWRWRFMLASTDIAVTAGVSLYDVDVTPGAAHVESVRLVSSSDPLEFRDADRMLDWANADAGNYAVGTPLYWTLVEPGTIMLYPMPAAPGTLTVRYYASSIALDSDDDELPIPDEHKGVVVAAACVYAAQRERQWDTARSFADERDRKLRDMKSQLALQQQQTSGRVRESGRYTYSDAYGIRGRVW